MQNKILAILGIECNFINLMKNIYKNKYKHYI